jgi:lipopolysaccharide/colanic/teichoic acid biosynthesis glycosyltransferase
MSGSGLRYCRGIGKRALDLALAIPALILLAPLLGVLALGILATMGRPVYFVQERVGLDGRRFRLLKLRSMRPAAGGIQITGRGDPRVTPLGRFLRASKLDELPQLFNVLSGRMSIVGPRPEVPKYVENYSSAERRVLQVRPGLTDLASLAFRDEEVLLGNVPPDEREAVYVQKILPRKLALSLEYIERASPGYDLGLIARTLAAVVLKARS